MEIDLYINCVYSVYKPLESILAQVYINILLYQ